MAKSFAFLNAWYGRTKPQVDRYLSGVAARLHLQSRGEAGGRSHPRHASEVDKAALSGLTAETVGKLSDDELTRLHRLSHQLAREQT